MRGEALMPNPALVGVPKNSAPTGLEKHTAMFYKKLHSKILRVFVGEGKGTCKPFPNIFSYLWNQFYVKPDPSVKFAHIICFAI